MARIMGITASTRGDKPPKGLGQVSRSFVVLVLLLQSMAFSAEIEGELRIGVSYTDNVLLQRAPNEIDDIVYQASPWLSVLHESPRLDADLRYGFEWYRYVDQEIDSTFHMGEASVTGKAWQETLNVEIGIRRGQEIGDPNDVIPPGRLPLSRNLVDRDEWFVNPRLNRLLGNSVTLDIDYRYAEGRYSDNQIQEDINHYGTFRLENYQAGQGLTWALGYDGRRTEYESAPPWENQKATAELGFWFNSKMRVFGAGGKESAWDNPLDPTLTDPFWEAGFAYTAGENLFAEFAAGERSFGSSWRGKVNYTFRRGSTEISYEESPVTPAFLRSRGRRSVLDPDALDDFLTSPGSAERFLSKRLQWNLELNFRRTAVRIALFDEDRMDRVSVQETTLADQSQFGLSASFEWQAGARTEFVASGSLIRRDTGETNRGEFIGLGLDVNYRLGERTALSLGYSYSEEQPRDQISTSRDYTNNIVSLLFTLTL